VKNVSHTATKTVVVLGGSRGSNTDFDTGRLPETAIEIRSTRHPRLPPRPIVNFQLSRNRYRKFSAGHESVFPRRIGNYYKVSIRTDILGPIGRHRHFKFRIGRIRNLFSRFGEFLPAESFRPASKFSPEESEITTKFRFEQKLTQIFWARSEDIGTLNFGSAVSEICFPDSVNFCQPKSKTFSPTTFRASLRGLTDPFPMRGSAEGDDTIIV